MSSSTPISFETYHKQQAEKRRKASDFALACAGLANFMRARMDHHSHGPQARSELHDTTERLVSFRSLNANQATVLWSFAAGVRDAMISREPLCNCVDPECKECTNRWLDYSMLVDNSLVQDADSMSTMAQSGSSSDAA